MDAAGQMTVVVVNQDTSEWIRVDTVFMDITTDRGEVSLVPSISFGGLALLSGLVFVIAIGGLTVQRRRREP